MEPRPSPEHFNYLLSDLPTSNPRAQLNIERVPIQAISETDKKKYGPFPNCHFVRCSGENIPPYCKKKKRWYIDLKIVLYVSVLASNGQQTHDQWRKNNKVWQRNAVERGWAISKIGSCTVPLMNSRRVRYSDSSCRRKVQKNGYQVQITVHVPYDLSCFLDMRDKIFLPKCGDFISKAAACNSFLYFLFLFEQSETFWHVFRLIFKRNGIEKKKKKVNFGTKFL